MRELDVAHLVVARSSTDIDREFTTFMASSTASLSRTAWLLCGDAHRAEELVQQTLMKTYLAWPRAREGDPLVYARRILANARIDSWRRHRRERLTAPEDLPDRSVAPRTHQHDDRDELVRALRHLTARQRRVVVLRHMVGLTEQEVADDLGVTVGTVKTTSHRALRRLRSLLTDSAIAHSAPTAPDEGTQDAHR